MKWNSVKRYRNKIFKVLFIKFAVLNELIYDIMKDEIYKQEEENTNSIEQIKSQYDYNSFEDEAKLIVDNLK
ncbi:hypothetical protein SAMN02745196_00110 [Clostridium collagenovorans DSM 3089]|uniref:Uncharacterized protein n=1 Tax=Clostridium collagenovorans DSM 3089 TaxID=1121306 RepID=A0A1M5SBM5_9CLOT|nr:hypothetical protein [Clostridium collagenovorans]SHH35861.1 hypothetical protein SAMN02745196_00110 [Clostridium collagenovorans DSM 3089]